MSDPWQLRPACAEDSRQIWEWANDAAVRRMAFNTAQIPWEGHERWFAARQASPLCHIFLLVDASGVPAGQIRFDELSDRPGVFEIDVCVAPTHRGQGVSKVLLERGEKALREAKSGARFRAVVKHENAASLALFRSAGYVVSDIPTTGPHGEPVTVFEK